MNRLEINQPRLGWFIDGDANTKEIAVMLQDTGTAIELTVPLKRMFHSRDPYSRWWASNAIKFGDDPDRTRYNYRPPRVLLVQDNLGPVVLIGCRPTRSSSNFHVGKGVIVANYAVLGGRHLHYERINGLRTEIPALAPWTRLSSMETSSERSPDGLVRSVRLTLTDAKSLHLSRTLNLTMKSTWRVQNPAGEFRANEGVQLETNVARAAPWDEHLAVHEAILNLASVAAWRPFGFSEVIANRRDDPERTMAGNTIAPKWSSVVTHRLPKHEDWTREPKFLFPFSEIGSAGVHRWQRLLKEYSRAISPLLEILRSEDPWSYSSITQSGVALEALGYLIDKKKNNGANLNSRQQLNFKPALRVILADMAVTPIDDHEEWIRCADATYMGLKHVDRPEPDSLVSLNTHRQNILVLRFWISLQLGAKPQTLMTNLEFDRLASEFQLAD